jgi:hypothetical protein
VDSPRQTLLALLLTSLAFLQSIFLLQGKDKERVEKDDKRSAERTTQDGKQAAEEGSKATAGGARGSAGDAAAAAVSGGDKGAGTTAAGEPAADAAAGLPKQEAANGTAPMDTDAPADKVIASASGHHRGSSDVGADASQHKRTAQPYAQSAHGFCCSASIE